MNFAGTGEQIDLFNSDLFPMGGVLFRRFIRKNIKFYRDLSNWIDILLKERGILLFLCRF